MSFSLTNPFAHDIRALAHVERHLLITNQHARSKGTGDQGLTGTWGTMEEDTTGRGNLPLRVELWIEEWQKNHFLEFIDMIIQTTDAVESKIRWQSQGGDIGKAFSSHAAKSSRTCGDRIPLLRESNIRCMRCHAGIHARRASWCLIVTAVVSN